MFEEFLNLSYLIYLLISSLLGMVAIYIGVRIAHELTYVPRAFFVALIANLITVLGILGILMSYFPIPFAYYILSAVIWVLLIKFFYKPLNFKHAIIIGMVAFVLVEIFSILGLAALIKSFIPI